MDYNRKRNELLKTLIAYYTPSKFSIIHDILIGEDALTMSIINFTVINYAIMYDACITLVNKKGINEYIYITRSYLSQLDEHRKQCFDAFCRKPKILFEYEPNKTIVTSVSQLNFYKWVIEIGLLEYIRENYENINIEYKNKKDHSSVLSSSSIKYDNKIKVSSSILSNVFDEDS